MPTGVYERTEYHRKRISEGASAGESGKHMKGRKLPKKWRDNISKANTVDKNYFWREGKYVSRGYVRVWTPKHPNCDSRGYVAEHRLIIEKNIGRLLLKEESVHHINGNKSDNRLDNLKLFSSESDHQKHHWELKKCTT